MRQDVNLTPMMMSFFLSQRPSGVCNVYIFPHHIFAPGIESPGHQRLPIANISVLSQRNTNTGWT